jgi:signal peptidase I
MSEKAAKKKTDDAKSPADQSHAMRETVESIVIAIILAFLFRGFVAEAFVIPTGSMAPTLQGRHIDVVCPECKYQYRAGASEENNRNGGWVTVTYCPLCRFPLVLDRDRNPNHRSFSGDRILVGKFSYEWSQPERWDVIVFKYPNNAKQNYIKRLVGLPNELVRIYQGDIYAAPYLFDWQPEDDSVLEDGPVPESLRKLFADAGSTLSEDASWHRVSRSSYPRTLPSQSIEKLWYIHDGNHLYMWRADFDKAAVYGPLMIQRKPAHKELALAQLVYDTDYVSTTLSRLGWPHRWQEWSPVPHWVTEDGKTYVVNQPPDDWAWLQYRHVYANTDEWELMLQSQALPERLVRAEGELITDYYAYNDRQLNRPGSRQYHYGMHWVGDLAVECSVELQSNQGQLMLRLVEGGTFFDCLLDLATGKATLSNSEGYPFVDDQQRSVGQPTADTPLRGPGRYRIRFSNVDDQLRLWINGKVIEFSQPTTYRPPASVRPRWSADDPGDLAPARIGLRGATARLSKIRLWRDVYYLALTQYQESEYTVPVSAQELQQLFRSPRQWETTALFDYRPMADFVIPDGAFMPLGDNSPQSQDARMWGGLPYLERQLLIGEAILIYFPHAWRGPFFPLFWPNFQRMSLIH